MIYSAIYKLKIQKETEKLYDLGGKQLVDLQEKYIKSISNMLGRWYKVALDELKNNKEAQYNELFIDQKQFINKDYTEADFSIYSKMMKDGFNIGAKQLNKAFKKDIKVSTTFSVDPGDALKYANEFAGARIKGVDAYSQKRIKDLVSHGLEKGWGYNKLAKELKLDYAFSDYRARLIASNEIGEAYINGKDRQFARYTRESGVRGWKHWVSHRDTRTTAGCLGNDNQGWIPNDEDFESGHSKPTRFPGCRCNVVYRLYDPRDNGEVLDPQNADAVDQEQSSIPTLDVFDDGIKPINYDLYSTQILPAKYFNAIGEQANYVKPKGRAHYIRHLNTINVGEHTDEFSKQWTEAHEVGHMFLTRVILPDETKFKAFKEVFQDSHAELKELVKNKELRALFNPRTGVDEIGKELFAMFDDLKDIDGVSIGSKTVELASGKKVEMMTTSPKYKKLISAFMDTIGSLNKESTVGWGHGVSYYKKSPTMYRSGLIKVTEMQLQEYFAHLNETFWIGNPLIEKLLPKTNKAMKEFYESIGYDFTP